MSYNIITSPAFAKELKKLSKKYPSVLTDIKLLGDSLRSNPIQGTPLGKDCFKIRMAITSKGKGKSGGARIVTCVKIVDTTVFLLSIYDKSEKESFSDQELDEMLSAVGLNN